MNTGTIAAIVAVVIVVVIVVWAIASYNSLISLRNRVRNGWAQIDVQLKQRADLVPNLVETVKGYAGHESEVFTRVTQARAGAVAAAGDPNATPAQRSAAENRLGRALAQLNATAEAYPQLQANRSFMDLQGQLSQLEQKIAYARQFYNDVVLKYNTAIETVPTNIVAGMFRFTQAQYFEAEETARQAPQVSFAR
ncbi:LemA family protein [Bifidobacterium phasiani]|uniref:LemA family protein n=1 Tax=Bifidobacterium phasiani TaxID=2834431 RepID=A0ABS6WD46_9BIFI|nr:LemA family protein [Bifidobacterium phasiani]MBW3083657.1 LemA family protein [Bifidobacterium phasiani]